MARRNALTASVPFEVETAIKRLGTNLRTARLRRNLALQEVAQKLGAGRHVIARAEAGKISTPVAVYVGLLWTYGLLDQLSEVADPAEDKEGLALSLATQRSHARRVEDLDNDF
jgi:ribosome-binding protein aMBF1 (putative translation factor)